MSKQKLNDKITNLSDNIIYELFKALLAASTRKVTFMHHWESALEGFEHWTFISPLYDDKREYLRKIQDNKT